MNSTRSISKTKQPSNLLKNALRGNALFSGTSGVIALLGAQSVAAFTGIEVTTVFVVLGIILIIYAIDLWWVSSKDPISHNFAWAAIILDILWVAGSIAILFSGWPELTVAGLWAVFFIAEVVTIFAILQYVGLRRAK